MQVATAINATMFIVSDGKFDRVPDFSYAENLTGRIHQDRRGHHRQPGRGGLQQRSQSRKPGGAAGLRAGSKTSAMRRKQPDVSLYLNDQIGRCSKSQRSLRPPRSTGRGDRVGPARSSTCRPISKEILRIEVDRKDQLSVDNIAYATLNAPRPARVLFVTSRDSAKHTNCGWTPA